jgi:hypothetical protein
MKNLLGFPAESWVIDQAIALDWYDGPRAGLCRLRTPSLEFAFEVLAERPTVDGMDERLFSLSLLPEGATSRVIDALAFAGPPAHQFGFPDGKVPRKTWLRRI